MKDVLNHMVGAIAKATPVKTPWPHLIVDEIFPPLFYRELLRDFPAVNEPMSSMSPGRNLKWLRTWDGKEPNDVPRQWAAMRARLFPALAIVLERKFGVRSCGYSSSVLRDVLGYTLEPHTDDTERLVTGLLYFPDDATRADEGTIIYRHDVPDYEGINHSMDEGFERVVQVDYLPNRALFFERTDFSYHGVDRAGSERRVMCFDLKRWA